MNQNTVFDVLVVGGTPAGCTAAIAAARSGKAVLILEPTQKLGGLTSNGIGVADTGSLGSLGGVFEEFCARIQAYYAQLAATGPLQQVRSKLTVFWEPHTAAEIWQEMVAECPGIEVQFGAVAVGVEMEDHRVAQVIWEKSTHPMGNLQDNAGETFFSAGKIVIDCTYESDIADWAGVPFRIGREAISPEEPHAGVIYMAYMAREPIYRHLPQTILPGSTGEASDLVMAASIRLICKTYTDISPTATHRIARPSDYDPEHYAWYYRTSKRGRNPSTHNPDGKFDLNLEYVGRDTLSRDIVMAHPRERQALRQEFIDYALGYLYYLQNDAGQPEVGLADDEFVDNHNIPCQVYIREGRRIQGLVNLTEKNMNPFLCGDGCRPPLLKDSIAVGDFELDSKVCHSHNDPDRPQEGTFFLRGVRAPFQVAYGCMVAPGFPNLLVPVGLSATHVAFSAARMEPVWAATGHAAGEAAVLMLDYGVSGEAVPIAELQERLIAAGAKLSYFRDVPITSPWFRGVHWAALRGVTPSDPTLRFRPDDPARWDELAEITVRALELPVSVTSAHFADVPPSHPSFRFVETLYDLTTRSGHPILTGVTDPSLDGFVELHRVDARAEWLLDFGPDKIVPMKEFGRFCHALFAVVDTRATGDLYSWLERASEMESLVPVTRGLVCQVLAAAVHGWETTDSFRRVNL